MASHALGLSEVQVLARPERLLTAGEAAHFDTLLTRRLAGEPMAYLTGEREFWGRSFAVDRRVLIPRPETEHLVEAALELELPESPRLLDVGTGSGCLAITLALELPHARVVATDVSPAALAVASGNAERLGATRVRFVGADRLSAVELQRFDLVVSNPPYIDPADEGDLSREIVDFEPHSALFAEGGDRILADLIADAARRLRPGGHLLLEIGAGQVPDVERHAEASDLHIVAIIRDYASFPRVIRLERR